MASISSALKAARGRWSLALLTGPELLGLAAAAPIRVPQPTPTSQQRSDTDVARTTSGHSPLSPVAKADERDAARRRRGAGHAGGRGRPRLRFLPAARSLGDVDALARAQASWPPSRPPPPTLDATRRLHQAEVERASIDGVCERSSSSTSA
eukprot:scaffold497_cov368-Prasinococcus_capsulatus_cf.AAC.2